MFPEGAGGIGVISTFFLPTTLEDLLAIAVGGAVGYAALLNLPLKRNDAKEKLTRVATNFAEASCYIPPSPLPYFTHPFHKLKSDNFLALQHTRKCIDCRRGKIVLHCFARGYFKYFQYCTGLLSLISAESS